MFSERIIVILFLIVVVTTVHKSQCQKTLQFQKSQIYEPDKFRSQNLHNQHKQSSIFDSRYTKMAESRNEEASQQVIDNHLLQERSNIKDIAQPKRVSLHEGDSYNEPCSVQYCLKDIIVNCAGLSLTEVRSTWFPRNTTIVLLDNNDVEVIDNVSFSHLNELRVLSLSNNNINLIQQNAFRELEHLETLNLEYNRLTEASYPPGVFDPLVSLTDLRLRYNKENSNLPDNLFTPLKNLNSLTIDANDHTFTLGNVFSNLTKLALSGNVKILDTESFENVEHITHLIVEDVPSMSNFTDTALQSLHHLDVFKLNITFIGVTKSLHTLKPLVGKNITAIIYDRVSFSLHESYTSLSHNEGILNLEKTQYLVQICIRDFTLKSSHIFVIEGNALFTPLWKECLRNFDMSGNPLLGNRLVSFFLFNLKNIETVNIENSMKSCYEKNSFSKEGNKARKSGVSSVTKQTSTCDAFPTFSSQSGNGNKMINGNEREVLSQIQKSKHKFLKAEGTTFPLEQKQQFPCSYKNILLNGKYYSYVTFYFSSSLKRLQLGRLISSYSLNSNFVLVGLNNLIFLNLMDNGGRNFTGTLIGFDSLQTFILSGNDVSNLAEHFFDGMCNLEELDLSNCRLDTDFFAQKSARIMEKLRQLKRLDLSSNMLYSLQPGTFASNKILQLDFFRNRFKNIPFNLKDTPNLKMLDLRENSLPSLEPIERDELDKLANQPGGFDLLISGNVLSCGCDSLKFLYWLATTRVRLDIVHNFTCMNNEGQLSYWSISDDLEEFWRKCWGEIFFSLAVILLFSMVIGFLSVFVIWKNKTFLWKKLLEIVIGYRQKCPSDYKTGVFIGYADKDYIFSCFVLRKFIEDELHLNTYVSHRDMDPSWYVAKSIVQAMNCSWRIILVFSENFLFNDEWSMFSIFTAISSVSPANPARVVVLVHENLQHRLPNEVLSAVSEDNIIVVSSWTMNYHLREKLRTRLMQI